MPRSASAYLREITTLCVFVTALALPQMAGAVTPEEKAGARAAAQAGGKAFQEGRFQEAIDYFNRAESIIHAPPHLLYIARSELKLGHLVASREAYLKIVHEELDSNAPRAFREAHTAAESELDDLEPRLPFVNIVIEGAGSAEVTVLRDDTELPAALVGIPIPTDPGSHTFQAKARGLASEVAQVTVKDGEKTSVSLRLAPTGEPLEATETDGTEAGEQPSSQPAAKSSSSEGTVLKILGYTGIVLGVGGLATGTVFVVTGADTQGKSNGIYNSCAPNCSSTEKSDILALDDQARTESIVGYTALGVGAAVLATGITLLVVGSKASSKSATAPQVWPVVGLGSLGLAGTF